MSLKAIEMQVALPRTFEAGKSSQQHQQQGQMMQEFAGMMAEKELQKKKQTVVEANKSSEAHINRDEKGEHQSHQENAETKKRQNENKKEKQMQPHPYKGNQIDFSG